jgi:hypothetical protein
MTNALGKVQAKRAPLLAAAGLAVVAAVTAFGQSPALASRAAPAAHGVTRAAAATEAAQHPATFHRWWAGGGRAQFAHVARDLRKIILTDVVQDKDSTFTADVRRLITDTTAALGNPPPVGTASYLAAMRDFKHAGQAALGGSYVRAYAAVRVGLQKMDVFIATAKLKSLSVPCSPAWGSPITPATTQAGGGVA